MLIFITLKLNNMYNMLDKYLIIAKNSTKTLLMKPRIPSMLLNLSQ